jgi:hypothetical protein
MRAPPTGARPLTPSKQGKAPEMSRYCPLDLFGGAPELQEAALAALMECPCNNLKARQARAPAAARLLGGVRRVHAGHVEGRASGLML